MVMETGIAGLMGMAEVAIPVAEVGVFVDVAGVATVTSLTISRKPVAMMTSLLYLPVVEVSFHEIISI